MTFDEWIQAGIDGGWAGPSGCVTHDGIPSSMFEEEKFKHGHKPCIHAVRVYADDKVRQSVEANHVAPTCPHPPPR